MLKTKRLSLCPMSDEEMKSLIQTETDEEMKQAYQEMLDGCLRFPAQRIWYTAWKIELPGIGIIGDLCFKGVEPDGMVEIGYGLHPTHWGKGYATEAVSAVAEWAAKQNGITRIEAETEETNIASQRVLAKAGFVANGAYGKEGPRFVWKL